MRQAACARLALITTQIALQRSPLVNRNLVGLVTLDDVLRLVFWSETTFLTITPRTRSASEFHST